MRLVFLGSGGYYPNERRQTACIMLPEIGVVFDAGTGFSRVAGHLATDELRIFLSHAHLDHIVGLTYFIVPLIDGQVKQAQVFAQAPVLQAIDEHLFAAPLFPLRIDYLMQKLDGPVLLPDGGRVTWCPLQHPGGSTGYRIDWPDRSLAYITDTIANGSYLEFIRGVDVLIHECYFPDDRTNLAEMTGHSHTTPVAAAARAAGVGQLWLVHIDPLHPEDDPIGLATARAIFPETHLAEDRLEIEI